MVHRINETYNVLLLQMIRTAMVVNSVRITVDIWSTNIKRAIIILLKLFRRNNSLDFKRQLAALAYKRLKRSYRYQCIAELLGEMHAVYKLSSVI